MKRKLINILMLIALALSVLGCGCLFGCGTSEPDPPVVTSVSIVAEDESSLGKTGVLHHLNYTLSEQDCTLSFSVARGGKTATAEDYTCKDGGYIFHNDGEYQITVYAAKNGMLGSASASLTVTSGTAYIGGVSFAAAAGEPYGKVGAMHLLQYTAAVGSEVTVEIKDEADSSENVEYDAALRTVVFKAAGKYTATVRAELAGEEKSAEAEIVVAVPDAPKIDFKFEKGTADELETVYVSHTVSYATGDSKGTESISVRYRVGSTGSFRAADESTYELKGDLFTPYEAGQWRLTYEVKSKGGAEAEKTATLVCRAATLTPPAPERILVGSEQELDYHFAGTEDKYNVTIDTHGQAGVTAEKSTGDSIRVKAEKLGFYTVTLHFTNKKNSALTKTLDLKFYTVENLTFSPAWGEDPFDGMPAEVLTNMGHMMYFDATSVVGAPLTWQNVEIEVLENNITAASCGRDVKIMYAGANGDYPYLFVDNLDDGVAQGTFLLEMKVTDPYSGYSVVAEREFTVCPTLNDNTESPRRIREHVEKYSAYYDMGSADLSVLGHDCRLNMILTKTGVIMHRTNADWPLGNGNVFAEAALDGANTCTLDFGYALVAPNSSNEACLRIAINTARATEAAYIELKVQGGRLAFADNLGGTKHESIAAASMPLATAGTRFAVRIARTLSGSTVRYTVSLKEGDGEYRECYYKEISASASAGASVRGFVFSHTGGGGCYLVESITATKNS